MSLTHIETIELGSSQSSITFSSIPQDYDDLVILVSARSTSTGGIGLRLRLGNGTLDTGSNYNSLLLQGTGSSVATSVQTTTELFVGVVSRSSFTANTFSNGSIYISNYTALANKSISVDNVSENNATESFQFLDAGLHSSTSSVDIAQIFLNSDSLETGTTASLYGVTAGGDGTVTTA